MVILITGASHTGKTLLAQRMLERYIDGFKTAGEKVFLIRTDYEQMIQSVLGL